jgi:alpha-amylase
VDVPESEGTVSWADLERDSSGWLGNAMQWAYYTNLLRLEPLIKEAQDPEFLKLWRFFQTSDHLYYMFAKGGGPGEVHSYFSPYESPVNAFVAAETSVFDFENRVRLAVLAANEPFLFCTGIGEENFTGIITWSLKGFLNALETAETKVIEFHCKRGDFESWAEHSLHDEFLQKELKKIRLLKLKGDPLREKLVVSVKTQFDELSGQVQAGTKLF